jgi:hypothetical protein
MWRKDGGCWFQVTAYVLRLSAQLLRRSTNRLQQRQQVDRNTWDTRTRNVAVIT